MQKMRGHGYHHLLRNLSPSFLAEIEGYRVAIKRACTMLSYQFIIIPKREWAAAHKSGRPEPVVFLEALGSL